MTEDALRGASKKKLSAQFEMLSMFRRDVMARLSVREGPGSGRQRPPCRSGQGGVGVDL
jgi:hypothetical protein